MGLLELQVITNDAKLYSIRTDGMPRLQRCEIHCLQPQELPWIRREDILARANAERPLINKTHGFVVGEEFRQPGDRVIRYVGSDYAMVRAARDHGVKPPIISANAIIFCPSTKRVLVHVRAPNVATYPNALHFIGGNYEPSVEFERYDDLDSESPLRHAAIREVKEETGIIVSKVDRALVLVGEEIASGFVQFTYAGISVLSESEANNPSLEGGLAWFSLTDLCRFAETGSLPSLPSHSIGIVPSFAINLLMWLKLGAPDERCHTPMRKEALAAYSSMLPHIHKRLSTYTMQ